MRVVLVGESSATWELFHAGVEEFERRGGTASIHLADGWPTALAAIRQVDVQVVTTPIAGVPADLGQRLGTDPGFLLVGTFPVTRPGSAGLSIPIRGPIGAQIGLPSDGPPGLPFGSTTVAGILATDRFRLTLGRVLRRLPREQATQLSKLFERCRGRISVSDAAKALGLSRRSLQRGFRLVGLPAPGTVLRWLRVGHAISLRESYGYSLSRIAYLTEFSDPSNLNRTVRDLTGRSISHFNGEKFWRALEGELRVRCPGAIRPKDGAF